MDAMAPRVAEIAAKIDTPATGSLQRQTNGQIHPASTTTRAAVTSWIRTLLFSAVIVDAITNKDYQAVIKPELVT